ncbi:hypothetical protein MTO96_033456 [Rhipicephalus appendiculatus]
MTKTFLRTHIGEACLSYDENTLAQALDQINGTYDVVGIKRGTFARVLRRKQVDIVVNSVGITRDRHRLFAFTANKFGQAVFYVKKTWKHETDLFSFGGLPLMLLSASSMLLSVGCIVFLNVRRGRRPMNGLGDVVLALTGHDLSVLLSVAERPSAQCFNPPRYGFLDAGLPHLGQLHPEPAHG